MSTRSSLNALLALAALAGPAAAAERPLVLVIDQSASMQDNDPRRYAVDAAQLAVATLRPEKSLMIVGFAREAKVLIPWTSFATPGARIAVRDQLADLKFTGTATRYSPPLKLVAGQLGGVAAAAGSRTFFLTDGNPDDSSNDIAAQSRVFASQGWIVEAMRLNKENGKSKPDLLNIATETRGSHIEVTDAAKLVDHFVALTNAENDFFDLDVSEWTNARQVAVPDGAERLTWIVAKNLDSRNRGILTDLACDGVPVNLDAPEHYRVPAQRDADASRANVEVAVVNNPKPGTYTCDFKGMPAKVYVSLSFAVRVEVLPTPPEVFEGTVIRPGLAIIHSGSAGAQRMASSARVEATFTDTIDGSVLYQGQLPMAGDAGGAVSYTRDWPAVLTANANRAIKHPVECSYTVRVGPYRLGKRGSFIIDPSQRAEPPPPAQLTATVAAAAAPLPPTWTGMEVAGAFTVTTSGVDDSGSLTFSGRPPFAYPEPVAIPAAQTPVAVRFRAGEPGRYTDRPAAAHPRAKAPITGPELIGFAYGFSGREELAITGSGPTPIATWVVKRDDMPAQALRPLAVRLTDAAGRTAEVAIAADGAATVTGLPAARTASSYSGTAELRYGDLPPRRLALRLDDTPPRNQFSLAGNGLAITPGAAWTPGTWTEAPQELNLDSGSPGRVEVALSDLTGPEGEVLTASRDLRAVIAAERVAPGSPARFTIRIYRGRDALPGTYKGTATITYHGDNGQDERFTRDVSVTIP
jgi:hypothetical protein